MLCSGAPLDMCDDHLLGAVVRTWHGRKIVCGGTTAKIVGRELGLSVTVDLDSARGTGLPPTSIISGIDIVSEGIITLGRVRNMLHSIASGGHSYFTTSMAVDSQITKLLLSNRTMLFMIGTRLNKAHFDPWLPIKLEKRVDLLEDIEKILRDEFRKQIEVRYL